MNIERELAFHGIETVLADFEESAKIEPSDNVYSTAWRDGFSFGMKQAISRLKIYREIYLKERE